ncbi:MAG: Sodium/sulfate symporter [Candidatus Magnetoglobus multicellularis str. Araruama]|uniref:Sodium/sulfate symporter n=1 Tax=Candidatus Magnetoglobus multicellularis str. Araruama TaxID=890399 RepID=A0A1V1PGC1_9BACT|nr:MAG: Sodium/sulfate symporter [Candidatus Magnetoglobus multicellularis str. Araruama]
MSQYTLPQYVWYRLPMILIFANSYLVYRMLVATQLTDLAVQKAMTITRGNIYRIIVYVLCSGALLSFFIPNAVSVLILLPIIKQIENQLSCCDLSNETISKITTALGLAAIYGANIGGMGSLVGSPANLLLIGALDLLDSQQFMPLTFLNWFLWSIPLVICFLVSAFFVIRLLAMPSGTRPIQCCIDTQRTFNQQQRQSLKLFGFFIIFWIIHSIAQQRIDWYKSYQSFICLAFVMYFISRLFVYRPVLTWKQMIDDIPFRGFFVLILFGCIMVFVRCLHLDQWAAECFDHMIPDNPSPVALVFWITGLSIFLTEFLSNTIVSTALFPVVYHTAQIHDIMPLLLMIPVSVASTCAFMTPIATPCNAFVYGEVKRIRLLTMILCGLVLNGLCILSVVLWIPVCIPLLYSI